ncbi:MAG: YggT family protein [Chloroflexota bacterium]|nr:YggT family protein [Chloroflexota bacterium]
MSLIITLINTVVSLLTLLIILNTLVSYFLSPYHPIRSVLDKILEPMLAPIRRLIPPTFGFDFSPVVLIILLQVINAILIALIRKIK